MSSLRQFGGFDSHDFMGKNGFVWWIGIVENPALEDPLGLNRVKVRILGYHNDDDTIQPVEDLPWAIIMTPVANPTCPVIPDAGTWVLGFFLDGSLAQQPVILGALVGYRKENPFSETIP